MTSKELLYVEDALGHEKYFQTKCMEAAAQMQDEDLKQCVTQMAEKHRQLFLTLLPDLPDTRFQPLLQMAELLLCQFLPVCR